MQKKFEKLSAGQRMADKITLFAGSWTFILCFLGGLCLWMYINSSKLFAATFDPYPYILLNLVLSCMAAIQAPIILMSQSRQSEKEAEISHNDYMVDREAYEKIVQMEKKLDELLKRN